MGLKLATMTNIKSEDLAILGNKLRTFRVEKIYSQERLAELTGLDRTYISGLERGQRNPSFLIIKRLLTVLEISSNQLFEGNN